MSKRLFWWAFFLGGAYYRKEFFASKWVWLHNKNSFNLKTLTLTVHGAIFGRAFKKYGRIFASDVFFSFFLGGGRGVLFLGRLIFGDGGGGGAYYILRYSLVRTCVKSCQL